MDKSKRNATTAERLREAMHAAGKKQVDLVRETGIERGAISRYLAGKYEPKQAAINKLAVALNVSEMWLWGYDVPMQRTAEQKKNDTLVGIVQQLRRDPEFYDVVEMLAELPADQYDSIKQLLTTLRKK
jgi:transcriptional regulator with XRE-family HTH domain